MEPGVGNVRIHGTTVFFPFMALLLHLLNHLDIGNRKRARLLDYHPELKIKIGQKNFIGD